MRTPRRILLVGIAIIGALMIASATQAAGTDAQQCGFVRASVPYTHHGRHDRWRVYVRGAAACSTARGVLNAVMHLNATAHNGSDNLDSYFSYRGWACDFGQMGFESCTRPRRRPYTAGALAIDCQVTSCPVRVPVGEVPAITAPARAVAAG